MSPFQSFLQMISDSFGDIILYSAIKSGPEFRVGLGALFLVAILLFIFTRRARSEDPPELRPLPGLSQIDNDLQWVTERGEKVHISIGVGSLAEASAVQTLAGIDMARQFSRRAAALGTDFTNTTASPVSFPVIKSASQAALDEIGASDAREVENTRFLAPQPIPYATGVMRILQSENIGYNAMIGFFGDEYLLMGETAARGGITQLAAATNPSVLPFVLLTANYPLIGEELFAASTYLEPLAPRVGSIRAQDVLRIVVIVTILGGAVLATIFGFTLR